MVGGKGWFMTFRRTKIKLVNLLWWIIIGTTATPSTETPPSLVSVFVSGKCLSGVPFPSPMHLTEKFFCAVTEGIGDIGEGVSGSGEGGLARSGRGGRRGGKATTMGPG